ncbi:hypothetical protein BpHYR1_025435 [Brachionus plicatilis]|uniref:Uncharacterized protein n=1 Tax=Brachionus plicatilis TaxID=10195 RepID=A0A3M7P1C1_BRAPC|nr:hypothetical protein BpHYR1_025435 [Brachionus plicatilis]
MKIRKLRMMATSRSDLRACKIEHGNTMTTDSGEINFVEFDNQLVSRCYEWTLISTLEEKGKALSLIKSRDA